jgi:predicted ribosomally synthesized peptide with nif11-like leader
MSQKQLNAFAEAIKADTDLQQELNGTNDIDTVVQIARDRGFVISADDLERVKELSDEQLADATGGQCGSCWAFSILYPFA